VTAQIFWLKTRAKWRETPVELKHSGSIARKDLSEVSDEELLSMIYTMGAEIGLAPLQTIDTALSPKRSGPAGEKVVTCVPKIFGS
jgi:hypothetical protein